MQVISQVKYLKAHQSTLLDPAQLQFWKVTLIGHGADAQLSAQYITSIPSHDNQVTPMFSMSGNTVARGACFMPRRDHIEVYDWKNSTNSMCQRALVFVGDYVVG